MTDKNVCENWHFVYQDITYPDLPQYPLGYYSIKKRKKHMDLKKESKV